jgi:hypothetical protein
MWRLCLTHRPGCWRCITHVFNVKLRHESSWATIYLSIYLCNCSYDLRISNKSIRQSKTASLITDTRDYIYIERERERERHGDWKTQLLLCYGIMNSDATVKYVTTRCWEWCSLWIRAHNDVMQKKKNSWKRCSLLVHAEAMSGTQGRQTSSSLRLVWESCPWLRRGRWRSPHCFKLLRSNAESSSEKYSNLRGGERGSRGTSTVGRSRAVKTRQTEKI